MQYATHSVKYAVKTIPYAAVQCCLVCPFCFAVSAEYAVGLPHTDSINIVRLSLESLIAPLNFDQLLQKQLKGIREFK